MSPTAAPSPPLPAAPTTPATTPAATPASAPGSSAWVAAPDAVPLAPSLLADIARGLAAAEPLWRGTARHDPDRRRPVRLLATGRYEVWVIGWTTHQQARLHDHGASTGALVVTAGELTELVPRWAGGPGRALVEQTLRTGQVRTFPAGVVHDVVNRGSRPATSIHVYSPPLTSMTYYDPVTLRPAGTVAVPDEEPVLRGHAAARLLHPSRRGPHRA